MGELGDRLREAISADEEGFGGVLEGAADAADELEARVAKLEAAVLPRDVPEGC